LLRAGLDAADISWPSEDAGRIDWPLFHRERTLSRTTDLSDLAFPFVPVPPREGKPRKKGLTSIADRGMSTRQVEDVLEASGDYVDLAKIAAGMFRLQSQDFLRRKIGLYKEAGIEVFFAGDASEAAFLHGRSAEFYAHAKDLGADAMEISSAQVSMSLEDKCRLIRMCASAGLKPIAEVGEKAHEEWTGSEKYVKEQVKAYIDAGSWKVLFQDEGVSRYVDEIKTDLILNTVAGFDIQKFLFQVKVPKVQLWLVTTFGNSVNLDVDSNQVLEVEMMRRGLRGRGTFGLVGALAGE
jgi:phosphosulfolactate synthase